MKDKTKLLITILLVVLPLALFLFTMIYQPGVGMYVRAENVTFHPENM